MNISRRKGKKKEKKEVMAGKNELLEKEKRVQLLAWGAEGGHT